MTPADINALAWEKQDGLMPAIVQHAQTGTVLMQGYMNREALQVTLASGRVTFFSRSRQCLWTKGETSGNFLNLTAIAADCDHDSLLLAARPDGPTCHTGAESCFGESAVLARSGFDFLARLEDVIAQRVAERPEGSYTARLWNEGRTRLAQKVGEEGIEVALAAVTQTDDKLLGESADLLFHLALLLKNRGLSLHAVVAELQRRHEAR